MSHANHPVASPTLPARARPTRWPAASALVAVALLAGCATSYQPSGFTGGFDEVQLADNVYRVQFRGNGMTSTSRAEDLALLRCAELTLIKGYSHFAIIGERHGQDTSSIPQAATSFTTAVGGTLQTTTYGGGTLFISRPRSRNTVMMFHGAPPNVSMSYDARLLCRTLAERYGVACRE